MSGLPVRSWSVRPCTTRCTTGTKAAVRGSDELRRSQSKDWTSTLPRSSGTSAMSTSPLAALSRGRLVPGASTRT